MKILIFLHGTSIMHRNAVGRSREERVRQSAERENSVLDYASYVPVGDAVQKLRRWVEQGATIVYLSSHTDKRDVEKDKLVLKQYGFPKGEVLFRSMGETYADVAERVKPDILIEDDCESIGGEKEMTYPHLKQEIKERVHSIVVREFEGIDHLPNRIPALITWSRGAQMFVKGYSVVVNGKKIIDSKNPFTISTGNEPGSTGVFSVPLNIPNQAEIHVSGSAMVEFPLKGAIKKLGTIKDKKWEDEGIRDKENTHWARIKVKEGDYISVVYGRRGEDTEESRPHIGLEPIKAKKFDKSRDKFGSLRTGVFAKYTHDLDACTTLPINFLIIDSTAHKKILITLLFDPQGERVNIEDFCFTN